MKIDRLLAITIYLMNHSTVSASSLAERFEVSKRTIQRDVDSLCMAGVPVASTQGAGGGYSILDGFRMQKQIAGADDYRYIAAALMGLVSAYGGGAGATLEKVLAATPKVEQRVFFDLSAAREGPNTSELLRGLESAIQRRMPVEIEYTDSESRRTTRIVEPLALSYQWYAWYLFAYCRGKKDYRLFKLPRISSCRTVGGTISAEHGDIERRLRDQVNSDARKHYDIRLLCNGEVRQQALEYLNGRIEEECENGDFVLAMSVPYERMWFSLLLGFGEKVRVLEPEELKAMLWQKAEEIISVTQ